MENENFFPKAMKRFSFDGSAGLSSHLCDRLVHCLELKRYWILKKEKKYVVKEILIRVIQKKKHWNQLLEKSYRLALLSII